VAAWAATRTVGIEAVAALAEPEALGRADLMAAVLGGAATVAAVVAVAGAGRQAPAEPRRPLAWVPLLAAVPALVGMSAPHAHGAGDDHGDGHAAGAAHADAAAHTDGGEHPHDEAAPVTGLSPLLAGADTSGATAEEAAAAIDLIEATRAGTSATLVTVEQATAAGYVWIGDGRQVGKFQHYVNPALIADDRILDPDAVESLVYENTASGPELVSAMYLLPAGATMADVPDVAGPLTTWHDHQNLCWDESGVRLAGVVVNGTCTPGGVQRGTSPMLHVWLTEHPCGPFAGIEGHGSGTCAHEH
jgi:hypothetical protein